MSLFSRLRRGAEPPAEAAPLPFPPDSPEGLAARWVRWAAAVPFGQSPIDDPTGELANAGQPEDVFFLAGTFGGIAERRCSVPAGRPLFVPVFNMWEWPAKGGLSADVMPDMTGTLHVDGISVPVDRVATSQPFDVAGARGNPVTRTEKPVPAVVVGLWKRLDALTPGAHEVRLHGTDGHGFEVGVHYRLQVG